MRNPIKAMLRALCAGLLLLLLCGDARSWKEHTTHNEMAGLEARGSQRLTDFLEANSLREFEVTWADPFVAQFENDVDAEKLDTARREGEYEDRLGITEMVMFGSVHEDSFERPYWRSNSHFWNPRTDEPLPGFVSAFGKPHKAHEWALLDPDNEFDYTSFLDYIEAGWTNRTRAERREPLFLAFFTAGHLQHLIEDMHQPSHSRNDIHVGSDEKGILAFLGRSFFGGTVMEDYASTQVRPRHNRFRAQMSTASPRWSESFQDYFRDAAMFSHRAFFSDTTILFDESEYFGPREFETNWDTLLDKMRSGEWRGQVLTRSAIFELGELRPAANLRVLEYMFAQDRFEQKRGPRPATPFHALTLAAGANPNPFELEEAYATQILPRAASHGKGLLDFLFRGRLEIGLLPPAPDGRMRVSITNTSVVKPGNRLRPDEKDLTFVDGTINLYWEFREPQDPPGPATLQVARTDVGTDIPVSNLIPGGRIEVTLDSPTPEGGLVVRGLRAFYRGNISARNPEPGFAAACWAAEGPPLPGGGRMPPICGGE